MNTRWYDLAVERLEADLNAGLISDEEFGREMRELNAELRGQAEDAAQDAYDDIVGRW